MHAPGILPSQDEVVMALFLRISLKVSLYCILPQIAFCCRLAQRLKTFYLCVVCLRIYDWMPEQPNIFQTEQLERLRKEVPELKSCVGPTVSHFSSLALCRCRPSSINPRMAASTDSF